MKRIILFITLAILITVTTNCHGQKDPAYIIKRYVELHKAKKIDSLLAMHTSDSEFVLPGGKKTIRGLKELRDLFEFDSVFNSTLKMYGIHAVNDTIFVDTVIERNKWFKAIGVNEVRYRPGTKFVFRNGLISGTYPATFDENTQQQLKIRYGKLMRWLRKYRPDVLQQLFPKGEYHHNTATAKLWLKVLAEWKNSSQSK